jgi:hypothetical protein
MGEGQHMDTDTEMVARGLPVAIGFEQVVFERADSSVEISVSGMTAGVDPELVVFETPNRVSVSAMGSGEFGDQHEYSTSVRVDVDAAQRIVVCGEAGSESVIAGDLPEGLALVCSADPTNALLPATFLHRRGDRYVLMTRNGEVQAAHVA